MAIKTSLRPIVSRISEALRRSTTSQGMLPGDYAIIGSFDENTDRISLLLGTDQSIDSGQLYADSLQEIRRSFPEDPQFTMHVGLVIRKVQNVEEIYYDSIAGDDEIDLTELFERFRTRRP